MSWVKTNPGHLCSGKCCFHSNKAALWCRGSAVGPTVVVLQFLIFLLITLWMIYNAFSVICFCLCPTFPLNLFLTPKRTWSSTSITALIHFNQHTNEGRLVENKGCKCAPFQHKAPSLKNSREFQNSVVFQGQDWV